MSHTLIKVFLFSSSQFTAQDGGQGSITSLAVRCSCVLPPRPRQCDWCTTGPGVQPSSAASTTAELQPPDTQPALQQPPHWTMGWSEVPDQCHVATSMFITMSRDVCCYCVSICPCLDAGLVSVPDLGTRGGGGWLQRERSQPSAGFLPGPVFTRASNEAPHEGS